MTIAEKSIADNVDYAQLAVDAATYQKHMEGGAFAHFCANKEGNVYLLDDSGDRIHNGYFRYISDSLEETATLEEVKADFKAIIDATEYAEIPAPKVFEDLV